MGRQNSLFTVRDLWQNQLLQTAHQQPEHTAEQLRDALGTSDPAWPMNFVPRGPYALSGLAKCSKASVMQSVAGPLIPGTLLVLGLLCSGTIGPNIQPVISRVRRSVLLGLFLFKSLQLTCNMSHFWSNNPNAGHKELHSAEKKEQWVLKQWVPWGLKQPAYQHQAYVQYVFSLSGLCKQCKTLGFTSWVLG